MEPPPKLEDLPLELLQDISDILDATHPTSLVAFACTSNQFYAAASRFLFRTVKVLIARGGQEEPFQRVHDLQSRLLRDDASRHVRRLILCTDMNPESSTYAWLHPCERGLNNDAELWNIWDAFSYDMLPHNTPVVEYEWAPVVRLVEQLPGLADLYWVCPERLPLRLLEVLHEKQKLCRLHHCCFNLGSRSEESWTPYERTLLTSPCLYSISQLYEDGENFPYQIESARSIQSPNLRRVYLAFNSSEIQQNTIDEHDTPTVRQSVSREVIQMLALGGERLAIPFRLVELEASGDFSALRVLRIHHAIAPEGLPAPSNFPSLITLIFTCTLDENVTQQNWDQVATFLHQLPRLTALEIRQWDRAISVVPALSPNLRELALHTGRLSNNALLRDDHIHKLADLCPNLEGLTIEIRRSRGDAAEVARYRSLGRLTRLKALYISFNASLPGFISAEDTHDPREDTAIEPWFDEQDAKYLEPPFAPYRQGHVRDVLINSAIDEGLARSIFHIINDAKPFGKPSLLLLEQLDLSTVEGDYNPIEDAFGLRHSPTMLGFFLYALARRWRVERYVRDDMREVLRVRECLSEASKETLQMIDFEEYTDDQDWFGIWRRSWPVEKNGVNWWEDWKSCPLALENGGNRDSD